jgi:hypothetical protein
MYYAVAGGIAGAGAVILVQLFAAITAQSSGFSGLSGLGDALLVAALLRVAVLPFAAILAFVALRLTKEKPALPAALIIAAGAYFVFELLRAASLDAVALVALACVITALWAVGVGLIAAAARSRLVMYGVALGTIIVAVVGAPYVAEPIADAAGARIAGERESDRREQASQFTAYVTPTRASGPRLTSGDGGIEFTATPFIVVREGEVLEGQEVSIAPPHACNVNVLNDVLEGIKTSYELYKPEQTANTPVATCFKIGRTKDNLPIYQQQADTTNGDFYYYTRKGNTHIVLKVPLGYAVDPGVDINKEIISIVDALQPYSGTLEAARY